MSNFPKKSVPSKNFFTQPPATNIYSDVDKAEKRAITFKANFHGKIADLSPLGLAAALAEYAQIKELMAKPVAHANMAYCCNTQSIDTTQCYKQVLAIELKIMESLIFFEVELAKLPERMSEDIVHSPYLIQYQQYIQRVCTQRNHKLSEQAEVVIAKKKFLVATEFATLFDKLRATFRYRIKVDGTQKELSGAELLNLLNHDDQVIREKAFNLFWIPYKKHKQDFCSIITAISKNNNDDSQEHKFRTVMELSQQEHRLEPEVVNNILDLTEEYYYLARSYYTLKSQILRIEQLKTSDLHAPVASAYPQYTFDTATKKIISAFGTFDPSFPEIACNLLRSKRIDPFPRPGKIPGAICVGVSPSVAPYILVNFTQNLQSLLTLAHELGHGIHYSLAQTQNMINYHPTAPLAETAAFFSEGLVTRKLLETTKNITTTITILCFTIESIINTTFRQCVLTRFEQKLYSEQQARISLDEERVCKLWWQENEKLYGNSVTMNASYKWGWCNIPHFVHSHFYCYTYIYAQLLSLALHVNQPGLRCDLPNDFISILKAGGAISPATAIAQLFPDVNTTGVWHKGYAQLKILIDELKQLAAEAKYI